jgi:hypothetical protein
MRRGGNGLWWRGSVQSRRSNIACPAAVARPFATGEAAGADGSVIGVDKSSSYHTRAITSHIESRMNKSREAPRFLDFALPLPLA